MKNKFNKLKSELIIYKDKYIIYNKKEQDHYMKKINN